MNHHFDPTILREYDVRGVFGQSLSADDARAIGRSFATRVIRAGGRRVAVGMDGRVSSPILEHALVEGLAAGGVDVVRIGLGPTPMLYFAAATVAGIDGGVMITGSHNPANHNGFKMVLKGQPFFGADIADLGRLAAQGDWSHGHGAISAATVLDGYVAALLTALDGLDPQALAGLSLAWDAGNGAAGPVLERLVARLPGRHVLLHTTVDGTFPNHHPDPTIEANLADLRRAVSAETLDFGVAFDGDADRLGAVDALGRVVWGDQLLMILAQDFLAREPGAKVLADIKASSTVFEAVARWGGVPLMGKTGHSLMKARMKETGCRLAGEMSGHLFFADGWYGFDDGIYAALRLVAATVRLGRSLTELRGAMPVLVNTPELRFPVEEARKFAAIEEVRARLEAQGADLVAIDGVRVTTPDGWWLLRASNTQDVLVARAESRDQAGLDRLLAQVDDQLAQSGLSRA